MSALRERLRDAAPTLLDGGLGTELIARGLPAGVPPDRWTLDRGEVVTAVHRAYVEAGAEAIHANTFGANPIRLAAFGLDGECERINRTAIALARAAIPRFVFADVGPTGEFLPPVGKGDPARWRSAFLEQARVLAGLEVDALHIETMSDLHEARVALEALLTAAPGIPVLVSMTFERKKRGFFTIMGDPLVASLQTLLGDGATAAGVNCTLDSRDMVALARELAVVDGPVVVQPNAGTPHISSDGTPLYAQTADEYAQDMASIARWPCVKLVGGCCGTNAHFIAALAEKLRP